MLYLSPAVSLRPESGKKLSLDDINTLDFPFIIVVREGKDLLCLEMALNCTDLKPNLKVWVWGIAQQFALASFLKWVMYSTTLARK